jgi:benzil reductase ((S)-benzoin forming)
MALVTGTTSGIGAAVAAQLLDRGWTVVGMARRPAAIAHDRYRHVVVDLADPSAVVASVEREVRPVLADNAWRRVGLVNNAADTGTLRAAETVSPADLLRTCAVNVVSPFWLMGFAVRCTRADASLRIVNVSSAAAVHPFAGLSAYGSSKAALRMAGMIVAAELASPQRTAPAPADFAITSFEPGVVDTEMQAKARSRPSGEFPWVTMFLDFVQRGVMLEPRVPAAEIVRLLESDGTPGFTERRLGG